MKIDFTKIIIADLYGRTSRANIAQELGNRVHGSTNDSKIGDFGKAVFESTSAVQILPAAAPIIKSIIASAFVIPVQEALYPALDAIEEGKETEYLKSLKVEEKLTEAEELLYANGFIENDRLGDAIQKAQKEEGGKVLNSVDSEEAEESTEDNTSKHVIDEEVEDHTDKEGESKEEEESKEEVGVVVPVEETKNNDESISDTGDSNVPNAEQLAQ